MAPPHRNLRSLLPCYGNAYIQVAFFVEGARGAVIRKLLTARHFGLGVS